ncbi:MAG: Two-component system sensor histidine kinase [uncultured Ramlibacter sp.]|uniref:histidine kinase n=1 Tax=uncultured Ramlibacter sp. TaxID=260755 RepID=A0A6J4PR86_9BURK|nr:MAG: Two-component system sensor histidine kinase [uncultured Ramlibacter sp.]
MPPKTNPALLIEGFLVQTKEYALLCIDPDGTISAWLGAAEEIFGYREDEVVGTPASRLFTPEDRAKGFDVHELEVARRNSRSEDDRWHVRKDGTRIWVTGSVEAIRDSRNQVIGFLKVARDRTDLRAYVDSLENQAQASRAALGRTRAFLRTLGHEMRNPMAPLQSAALILQKTSTDPRGQKATEILLNQIGTLRRLADDLMDASRLDSGQVRLELKTVDLRDMLKQACAGYQAAAREKGVDLQALLPSGALQVQIDPDRFQQVVANLLSNAIKYTPAGGSAWIKATEEGGYVVVRVEDNGLGIRPDLLPKLFDLFTRGDSARDVEPEGLGVGLAVVREITELHGGTVQARSPGPGKGSEFTVRLPVPG